MSKHAIDSPSGYSGWGNCAGWESDPKGSKDADHGTAAHHLGAVCNITGKDPAEFKGQYIDLTGDEPRFTDVPTANSFIVDEEMVEAIQQYVLFCRSIPGEHFVEVSVPIDQITGEEGARGTSDFVSLADGHAYVVDLKYGKGVRVYADDGQLNFYAHGAMRELDLMGDITRVTLVICQPRLNHIHQVEMTVEELNAWAKTVKRADTIQPGEKQCRWCAKKATCPAIRDQILDLFDAEPDPKAMADDVLAQAMDMADMIESWTKSIRGEVERRLLAGEPVRGYKLVQGKRGNRAWTNAPAVTEIMKKSMRLKDEEMFEMKLISPTVAEKKLGAKQYERLAEYVTQAEGKLSVAPASDPRPATTAAASVDDFEVVH